jgi:hypothetical protein
MTKTLIKDGPGVSLNQALSPPRHVTAADTRISAFLTRIALLLRKRRAITSTVPQIRAVKTLAEVLVLMTE